MRIQGRRRRRTHTKIIQFGQSATGAPLETDVGVGGLQWSGLPQLPPDGLVLQGYGQRMSVAGGNLQELELSGNFLGTTSVPIIT